jgi:hypothetical protein
MYIDTKSLAQLKKDVSAFIQSALRPQMSANVQR